jgi:ATPase subunit of ABC transporter with duplicated ATPase domains
MSRPAPRAVAAFHAAPEKTGTFQRKDTGIGEAATAMVVHAEQHAALDRFGSPNQQGDRMSFPAAIVLDRVTKVYDEPVVFDVSLDVQKGNFVTLLGPSGSGKTTILQMIGGFVQPTTGRIFFGGTDMNNASAEQTTLQYHLPGSRPVSSHDRRGERRLWPQGARGRCADAAKAHIDLARFSFQHAGG